MKNVVKILILPMLLLSFANCGGTKIKDSKWAFEQNPPFKIENAYYQDWIAGVEGGGAGTNIFINFKSIDENVVVQNIYFQNQKLEAKTSQQNLNIVSGHLINVKNKGVIMDSDPMKEATNTVNEKFPFQLKENEAVLEYWFKGEKNYFKLSGIQKKELLPYPSANKTEKN